MNKIIYFVTFFLYSGFYALLAIITALGLSAQSRLFTVPLRLVTTLLMLYVIFKVSKKTRTWNKHLKINSFIISIVFFVFFIKVLVDVNAATKLLRSWPEYIFYSINFCILPYYMFSQLDFYQYKHTIINATIFSGFVMGVVCVLLYQDILVLGVGRISEVAYYDDSILEVINPLALSYCSVLTIGLCIFKLINERNLTSKIKTYYTSTIFLSLIMFFLGASRGSVVALFFMILSFFYFSNKKVKKRFLITCFIAIPLVLQGLAFTKSAVFDRVFNSTSQLNIDSMGRGDLWRIAWGYFIENPWFGGHIELIDVPNYRDYLPGNIYPHNMILEVFMSSGILVGLLFVFLIIFNFSQLFAALKKNPKEIWIIIILIVGFVQHFFSGAIYVAIMFFFPLGLLSSFITNTKK